MDLTTQDKTEALTHLCGQAARILRRQAGELISAVLEREQLGATAVGGGVAIPHGKVAGLGDPFLALARATPGIDWGPDAPDGQPVQILALVLSPLSATTDHLKVLALLGRLWNTPENLRLLLSAPDKESFRGLFLELAAIAA